MKPYDERKTIPFSKDIPEKPGYYWWRKWGAHSFSSLYIDEEMIKEFNSRLLHDDWYCRHRDSFAGPLPEPIDIE